MISGLSHIWKTTGLFNLEATEKESQALLRSKLIHVSDSGFGLGGEVSNDDEVHEPMSFARENGFFFHFTPILLHNRTHSFVCFCQVNELIARTEEEIEIFERMDEQIAKEREQRWNQHCADEGTRPVPTFPGGRLTEQEIPDYLFHPMPSEGDRCIVLNPPAVAASAEGAQGGFSSDDLVTAWVET